MSEGLSPLRPLAAMLALPGTVVVLIPTLAVLATRAGFSTARALWGLPLLIAGLLLFTSTVTLFWRRGRGTLAPWDPPRHLVLEGPYRHVRNPMISGVLGLLFWEALAFASPHLLAWAVLFLLANAIWIPRHEEPDLERRFGEEYRTYCRNVPRWLPRPTPWRGDTGRDAG